MYCGNHRNVSRTVFSKDCFPVYPGIKRKDFLCNSGRTWALSPQLVGREHSISNGSTDFLNKGYFDTAPNSNFPF